MAYVEPGTDFCLNCGEVVSAGVSDCPSHCRLLGEIGGKLHFEPNLEGEGKHPDIQGGANFTEVVSLGVVLNISAKESCECPVGHRWEATAPFEVQTTDLEENVRSGPLCPACYVEWHTRMFAVDGGRRQ